ncbi:MAG: hypothetical protein ACTS4T_01130 [Candidatus Hodgkinia cicadicola]
MKQSVRPFAQPSEQHHRQASSSTLRTCPPLAHFETISAVTAEHCPLVPFRTFWNERRPTT